MTKVKDLLSERLEQRDFTGKSETLRAPREINPARLADALMECFGADETLEAIEVLLDDQPVGYATRTAAYSLAVGLAKSVGIGDYNALPGAPDYKLIVLCYPVSGCGYRLNTMMYDEDHPPVCARHPNQTLEIRQ